MLHEMQKAFRRGLLGAGDADGADALGFIARDRVAPADRFSIYRNNTIGSLAGVLMAAYPVVTRLVGERFFRHAARLYIQAKPPLLPQLLAYGGGFPDFLAAFEPARPLPYLPEVARLEWARHEAYFAADAVPLSPQSLQEVAPEAYASLVFALHPSVRLVSSRYPVFSIWEANQPENETVARVDLSRGGDRVAILRPKLTVEAYRLSEGDFAFVTAIADGASLMQAADAALAHEPSFDLQQALVGHLLRGTFGGIR